MKQHRAVWMHYASCFVFLFLSLRSLSTATAQTTDWEKTHGSAVGGYAVQRLDDGGFIAVGAGGQWPATVGYLVRTDAEGVKVWEKTIGTGNPGVWVMGVKKTADGGFAVVGSKNSMPWLWKYTSDGGESWSRQLMGEFSYGDARAVVTVPDGIVVTGTNSVAGKYNLFVHKFSLAGDSLWSLQTNNKSSSGNGIRQLLDGNFMVVGAVEKTSGDEAYMVKVSQTGSVMWEKSFANVAGTYGDQAHDVSIASDGYLIVGNRSVDNNTTKIDVIKTTLDGTLSWRKQYGTGTYGGGNSVRPITDGYLIAGYEGTSSVTNGHLLRIDKDGGVVFDHEFNASYLHYVDQAIPPAKFVVVGSNMAGSQLYLARVDITTSTPAPDAKTFVYYYNNQPLWAFSTSNGWQGDGPGRIKLVAAKDTVRINGMAQIAATHFRIDTTRSSGTGSMSIQITGDLLATGSQPLGKSVLASGSALGTIEQAGIRLSQPLWSANGKGPGGTTMKIDLIQPGVYPASTEYEVSGTMRTPGLRKCGQVSTDIEFSGLHVTAQSPAPIDYWQDVSTEPGVCIFNVNASYAQSSDELLLEGSFQSRIYFPSGVRARGTFKNGELGELTLLRQSDEVPLGPGGNAFIRNLVGTYKPFYFTLGGVKLPLGYFAMISGIIRDKNNKVEIDVNNGAISAPGKLYVAPTSYRMYKAGNDWHLYGNSEVELEWSEGYINFKAVKGNFGAIKKKATDELYFLGQGNGRAHVFSDKPSTYGGHSPDGYVELPPELGFYLSAYGYLNELMIKMLAEKVVPAWAWIQQDTALLMPKYPGYKLGPIAFQLEKTSTDPGFVRAPTMEEVYKIYGLQILGFDKQKAKGHQTSAEKPLVDVMPNAQALYVRVFAKDGQAEPTTLVSPSGKLITEASADSSVQLLTIGSNAYWWVVDAPEPGAWKVNVQQSGDSAYAYVIKPVPEFAVSAEQAGNTVTVTWTNPSEEAIQIYLDDDGEGYDGISVLNLSGSLGMGHFTIPAEVQACEYRVYAMRKWGTHLQTDYADAIISVDRALDAPNGLAVTYNATDRSAALTWGLSTNPAVAGYAVRLTGNGLDSVVATTFVDQSSLTISVPDPNGYFVSIMSYDTNGSRSCWSPLVPLSTSDVKQAPVLARSIDAVVLPNPSRSRASLYLRMDEGSDVRITIYDAAGRTVNALSGFYPIGEHDINLQTDQLPSGSYVAVIEAGSRTQTRNFVITR